MVDIIPLVSNCIVLKVNYQGGSLQTGCLVVAAYVNLCTQIISVWCLIPLVIIYSSNYIHMAVIGYKK